MPTYDEDGNLQPGDSVDDWALWHFESHSFAGPDVIDVFVAAAIWLSDQEVEPTNVSFTIVWSEDAYEGVLHFEEGK